MSTDDYFFEFAVTFVNVNVIFLFIKAIIHMILSRLTFFLLILTSFELTAQKMDPLDKSPMDMVYYPDNFAHDRKFAPELIGDLPAIVRVIYSRPAKNGREIFGKLIPYDKVWRAGANESTEIKFYRDVMIQGKKVKAGTYLLFVIPQSDHWTIVINADADTWGAYSYKQDRDVLRCSVPVKKTDDAIENFSIKFSKKSEHETLMMLGWDTTRVEVAITF